MTPGFTYLKDQSHKNLNHRRLAWLMRGYRAACAMKLHGTQERAAPDGFQWWLETGQNRLFLVPCEWADARLKLEGVPVKRDYSKPNQSERTAA